MSPTDWTTARPDDNGPQRGTAISQVSVSPAWIGQTGRDWKGTVAWKVAVQINANAPRNRAPRVGVVR